MSTPQPYQVIRTFPAIAGFIQEVTMLASTNQIVTLADYTTIQNALAMQQSQPFTSVSVTFSGNTITITQGALSNVYIVILVAGVR